MGHVDDRTERTKDGVDTVATHVVKSIGQQLSHQAIIRQRGDKILLNEIWNALE